MFRSMCLCKSRSRREEKRGRREGKREKGMGERTKDGTGVRTIQQRAKEDCIKKEKRRWVGWGREDGEGRKETNRR